MKNFVRKSCTRTRAQLCPRLNRNTREEASVDTHGEKDKIVTVLPANRFCASPSTSLLLTVVVYTRSYAQSIDISVFFLFFFRIDRPSNRGEKRKGWISRQPRNRGGNRDRIAALPKPKSHYLEAERRNFIASAESDAATLENL